MPESDLPGPPTQPMPIMFDEEFSTDPWRCAGADADPPEELG